MIGFIGWQIGGLRLLRFTNDNWTIVTNNPILGICKGCQKFFVTGKEYDDSMGGVWCGGHCASEGQYGKFQ